MRPCRFVGTIVVLTAVTMLSAAGSAQTTDTAPTSPARHVRPDDAPPQDLLRGPKIDPEAARANPGFGGPARDSRPVRVPVRQWLQLLRELDLTPGQQEQIRSLISEFEQTSRRFQSEFGGEMRELRRKLQDIRNEGGQPSIELRNRMQLLQSQAPKPEVAQQRIWELLNEEQRQAMSEKLAKLREEIARRRATREAEAMDGVNGPLERGSAMNDMLAERRSRTGQVDRAHDQTAAARSRQAPAEKIFNRRLAFLREHRTKNRPGVRPSDDELKFDFEDQPRSEASERGDRSDENAQEAPAKNDSGKEAPARNRKGD